MRDKRMDLNYFKSYIDYQNDRINKKSSKLADCNDIMKEQRINKSLLTYKIDMLYAQFSIGTDKEQLKICLIDALHTASQVNNIDYENLLNLLSLSVIIEEKSICAKLIAKNKDMIQSDKLLNCLSEYIDNGSIVWKGDFLIKELYSTLNNLVTDADKENILYSYLSNWYDNHKNFAWYDTHKNGKDTYVGYWSFESAALVKIIGIDETKLKNIDCFPML